MSSTTRSEAAPLPPVFLFGFERSGTTLLSMMMGAHPALAVPLSVTGLWYRYGRRLAEYGNLASRKDLERLVDDLLAEERIGLWDAGLRRGDALDGLDASFPAVVDRFHKLYARHHGKPYWGNIDIATLDDMDQANRWFPDARFVHIVRDGRDVALSHETMPYGASNVLECAEQWVRRVQTNLKMGAVLGPERYLVVRYEDLVLSAETTLGRICGFIGLPYSPAMLDYPEMVEDKVPEDRRWLWPALTDAPDKSKVFGWKRRMSKIRRVVFEGVAHEQLEALGYETFARQPKYLPAYGYELWCFLGRGGRFRRLARKLGVRRVSALERAWKKGPGPRRPQGYEAGHREAFGSLVRSGVYNAAFQHHPSAQAFFVDCMQYALRGAELDDEAAVLECGCGPGAWLAVMNEIQPAGRVSHFRYFGFDLTPEVVEVARQRLSPCIPPEHLRQGDILRDESYAFDSQDQRYNIIYAYDVIQQLPRERQFEACQVILSRLAAGGTALLFDQDRESPFGRKMGFKKFVTARLGIPLVPRYYCNARYPALRRFAARLASTGRFATEIRVAPDGKKRALIVRAIPQPGTV